MGAQERRRALLLAATAMCGAILAGIAIATRGFGLIDSTSVDTREHVAAQQRCERDVVARLVAPSTAKLTDVTVTSAQLDPEVMDLFSLTSGGPLNGVDHSRISVRSLRMHNGARRTTAIWPTPSSCSTTTINLCYSALIVSGGLARRSSATVVASCQAGCLLRSSRRDPTLLGM